MTITIRNANLSDQQTITRFNCLMAWETESRHLDALIAERGVSTLLKNPSKGFYLIAESEGFPVGQCMITFEWSDWRCGDFWWIQSVYVIPEYRRQGVFTTLYSSIYEKAKASDLVAGIRLYVEHENSGAIETYLNLGLNPAHYTMFECDFTHSLKE